MSAYENSKLRPIFQENWERMVALGYSPVPLYPLNTVKSGRVRDKSPCWVGWSPGLRSRIMTREEVAEVAHRVPYAELGVVCAFKGLIAVDIDTLNVDAQREMKSPALGRIARGGRVRRGWGRAGAR